MPPTSSGQEPGVSRDLGYTCEEAQSEPTNVHNGGVTPELFAAIAATLAAVLAAVSLGVGMAREERMWRREALVDTVVAFLDASFEAPGELSLGKYQAGAYTDLDEARHGEAHQRMLRALTRLRVIASVDVVTAAERIHAADFARAQMLSTRKLTEDEWSRLGRARSEARVALLASARKAMGLKSAAVINSHLMRIPYTPRDNQHGSAPKG